MINEDITNTLSLDLLKAKAFKIEGPQLIAFKAIGDYLPTMQVDTLGSLKFFKAPIGEFIDCGYVLYELPTELVMIYSFKLLFSQN